MAVIVAALIGVLGVPASASAKTIELSPAEVTEAFFVAGDAGRLRQPREGTSELVLEKLLQQLYADEPELAAATAVSQLAPLKQFLATESGLSEASLQSMSGNQRILAILAALEHAPTNGAATKLALAHLASLALAGAADVFAKAETPEYFEPLVDERGTLTVTTFSPDMVLHRTSELGQQSSEYARARDTLFAAASHQRAAASLQELIDENPLIDEIIAEDLLDHGIRGEEAPLWEAAADAVNSKPAQLTEAALVHLGFQAQKQSAAQLCAHEGPEEPLGSESINGVPRLTCSGGALYEAAHAGASPETKSEFEEHARRETEAMTSAHAVAASAAALLEPAEKKAAVVLDAASGANEEIEKGEKVWAEEEAKQRYINIAKNAAESAANIATGVFSFVKDQPTEGAGDLVNAAFSLWSAIEEGVKSAQGEPENDQELALKDISGIRSQLSGFQEYTEETVRAVSTQIGQLSAEIAQENYDSTVELQSIKEKLTSEQATIVALQGSLQTLFSTQTKAELETTIADSVGWLPRTGELLPRQKVQESLVALNKYATEIANGALVNKEAPPFTLDGAEEALANPRTGELGELSESVSYLSRFPLEAGWSSAPVPASLPNTTFWNAGARAYSQLMLENPQDVTSADVSNLTGLETEGITLTHAQHEWARASAKGSGTGNAVLNGALKTYRTAVSGTGLYDHTESLESQLLTAQEEVLEKQLPVSKYGNENYSHLSVWSGAMQDSNNQASWVQQMGFPVLAGWSETEIKSLAPPILNAIRLGLMGAWESGSKSEMRKNVDEPAGTIEVRTQEGTASDVNLSGKAQEPPEYCRGDYKHSGLSHQEIEICENLYAHLEDTTGEMRDLVFADDEKLIELQGETSKAFANLLRGNSEPVGAVAGARALLQAYVTLGLPQAVGQDAALLSILDGANSHVAEPGAEAGTSLLAELETDASASTAARWSAKADSGETETEADEAIESAPLGDAIGNLVKWSEKIESRVRPYVEGGVKLVGAASPEGLNEESPLVETTVNRLQLTRDVLTEGKVPTAETTQPTEIGGTGVRLNGEVGDYGSQVESCVFEYGSTSRYGHSAPCEATPPASGSPSGVSAKVSGWTKNGSLHERLVVTTWAGTGYGEDVKIQLAEPVVQAPPTVVTGGATRIVKRKALLHGEVNPNGAIIGKCWVTIREVGGHEEHLGFGCLEGVGTGFSPTPVLAFARQLLPGTRYAYQFHAENMLGQQAEGETGEFETVKARK